MKPDLGPRLLLRSDSDPGVPCPAAASVAPIHGGRRLGAVPSRYQGPNSHLAGLPRRRLRRPGRTLLHQTHREGGGSLPPDPRFSLPFLLDVVACRFRFFEKRWNLEHWFCGGRGILSLDRPWCSMMGSVICSFSTITSS